MKIATSHTLTLAAMLLALAANGCMGLSADESSSLGGNNNQNVDSSALQNAQSRLFAHDIPGSRAIYDAAVSNGAAPEFAEASAGAGVTRILLLPYSEPVGDLLSCCLGGSRRLSVENDFIYSQRGLLYYLSLGVPFDDADGYPGILTLLEADLPWSRDTLEDPQTFFDAIDSDVNALMDALQGLTGELIEIEGLLSQAVGASDFETFFLPGEALHDEDLSLVLGRSELSAIIAVSSAARAGIHFLSAYDWDWSLSTLLGSGWSELTPNDAEYVEGWDSDDYAMNFLSTRIFRVVRNPMRLTQARDAAHTALASVRDSIRFGLEGVEYEFSWSEANASVATEIDAFLGAVQDSLTGDTQLPYTEPATTMDLSSFFDQGRVLAEPTPWFERVTTTDEFGDLDTWEFTDAAIDEVLIDGVFDPAFDVDEPPEVGFSGDTEEFGSTLVGDLQSDVEDAYLSGR